ncbi:hypothetical protein HBA54_14780 [Pelagibius litoralis]|uniref:Uncharacterized protein n=1 Tax=Pelagibius litoralis TaxID=374515 RepID=A0A967K9H0_9PROT|nr:hypothetical protein [Pelagibius litoralis]NIA69867.1 hypothetical protein [Pelagibius litoralis]
MLRNRSLLIVEIPHLRRFARSLARNPDAAAYVVYAPDNRHPAEVAATEAEHLSIWLSNRMGMAFRIPRLGDLGFELVGGRLMVGDHAPAALLMYENGQGRRLVFYLRNDLPAAGAAALTRTAWLKRPH